MRTVVAGHGVSDGRPEPLGVTCEGNGVNVAVFSAHAEAVLFCLFARGGDGTREVARIPLPARTGDVFHGHVEGLGPGQLYGLRAEGPFAPRQGHRFNPAKLLIDPWATRLDGPVLFHAAQFGHRTGEPDADLGQDDVDSAAVVPKSVVEVTPGPVPPRRPPVPWARTVVYELSVKGFTARHPGVPEALRGTFAGLAHPAAVSHLVDLGVTTVELMPAMAWVDERHLPPLGLANAWGYNPVAFMAPDPRLAPGGFAEVRDAVSALQAAGLEVILDVVLNHAGEADELGPTLSLRGLDHATYYRLRPEDPRFLVNDTGCGNTLALDRPVVLRLAMDALRTWAVRARLDGFRFDLAATMGRRAEGFDPQAPLLQAIAQDPLLRELKIIAEPWDIGPGGWQTGRFPAAWGEWNDHYRDDVRRFWRGDAGLTGALATRLAGSQDLFGRKGRPSRGINFVVAHDGFTLADLVSHERKHNEANGEFNRDGTDGNHSWNHGVEGPSDDPAIRAARLRDQRALLATLVLSRGTPMLAMGAEGGRSQGGNNNAYAQDNALNAMDWQGLDRGLAEFTARLLALRQAHPALHADAFLTGQPGEASLPDVEWLNARGETMASDDWNAGGAAPLTMVLAAPGETGPDRIAVILHRGFEPTQAELPQTRAGQAWTLVLDSASGATPDGGRHAGGSRIDVPARGVLLLHERPLPGSARKEPASPDLLDRLAQAAGIAPVWWEETGVHHRVTDETKRALLATMGLPAGTAGEVADALHRLVDDRVFAPLPPVVVATQDQPVTLPLPRASTRGRRLRLILTLENGEARTLTLDLAEARHETVVAPDGRRGVALLARLPPLPAGVHRLVREDRPEAACRLVVAPSACVLPPGLGAGRRRFGLGAHLYALRRDGDHGIGDFTTLALLGEEAARLGAATVGLNPLHALFPGQRDRASPYHPSDRRFIDPLYLDVEALGDGDPGRLAQALVTGAASDAARLSALRAIDYPAVWACKSCVLEAAFAGFETIALREPGHAAVQAFNAYLAGQGQGLIRFARFQALSERMPGRWFDWPPDLRDPDSPAVAAAADPGRVRYHAWLQWLCDLQMSEAARRSRAAGLDLGFYCDVAVGAAPDSAETWSSPGLFAMGASIGAPPDLFSAEGQVWVLPPPIPLVQERTAGEAFAELAAASMRHAGLLRIDHVMGLTRLFWVPDGARGRDGAYVRAPLDLLLARLALESARTGAAVVGEDLGTVPDGLRERLTEANVLSYRVLWFEREGLGFKPPSTWPGKAAACVSTHDLPTLAGWWHGADIDERGALGLSDAPALVLARLAREAEKRVLLDTLAAAGLAGRIEALPAELDPTLVAAIHAYVSAAPSGLMLAQVDDLVGERDAVNLPGTDRERPNWRRRLAVPVERLAEGEMVRRVVAALKDRL